MSLICCYLDELIGDRCSVMGWPYPSGLVRHVTKICVSTDKTFAYGTVGDTLTRKHQLILEQLLVVAFTTTPDGSDTIPLGGMEWFTNLGLPSTIVMTRNHTYVAALDAGKNTTGGLVNSLKRVDATYPIAYGTGQYVAAVAVLEGVPMKELTQFTSEIIDTVSYEGDYIHRSELQPMGVDA